MTGISETRTDLTGVAPQEPVLRIAISVIGRIHMFDLERQMLRLACGSRIAYVHKPLMTLMPREATHPHAFVNWRLLFWNCAIYRRALSLYHRSRDIGVPQGFSCPAQERGALQFGLIYQVTSLGTGWGVFKNVQGFGRFRSGGHGQDIRQSPVCTCVVRTNNVGEDLPAVMGGMRPPESAR